MSAVDSLSSLFKAIGSPARLQILLAIGQDDPCVCHLEATFSWQQAYLSQHLMALRKEGILLTSRHGRNIHYRLANPALSDLIRRAAEMQGLALPALAPNPNCHCPNCAKEPGTR